MTGFLLNKQKPFLSLVFNQPGCHGNSTHLSQNARIKSSVLNLYSYKKRAPKHKWLKSKGELGIGSRKLCSATLKEKRYLKDMFGHYGFPKYKL